MHSIPIPLLIIFIPRSCLFPHSTMSTINSNSHKGFLFFPRNLHPILDIIAWFPYGLVHFTCPFVVAIFLWLFRTKPTLHLRAKTFEYISVLVQLVLPCSTPCYELIYGLTPANYYMKGSPRGLGAYRWLFPLLDLYHRVYKFAFGIWSLSITPRRQRNIRSLIPITLLPPNYTIYLGICKDSLPGHHVSYPPLPHRWSLVERASQPHSSTYTFRRIQGVCSPRATPWPQLFEFRTNEK